MASTHSTLPPHHPTPHTTLSTTTTTIGQLTDAHVGGTEHLYMLLHPLEALTACEEGERPSIYIILIYIIYIYYFHNR